MSSIQFRIQKKPSRSELGAAANSASGAPHVPDHVSTCCAWSLYNQNWTTGACAGLGLKETKLTAGDGARRDLQALTRGDDRDGLQQITVGSDRRLKLIWRLG